MSTRYTGPILDSKSTTARDYLLRLFRWELRRGAVSRRPDPAVEEIEEYVRRLRALETVDAGELLRKDRALEAEMAREFRERAVRLESERGRLIDMLDAIRRWHLDYREAPGKVTSRSSVVRAELAKEIQELVEMIDRLRSKASEIDAELAAGPGDGEKIRTLQIVRIADDITGARRHQERRADELRQAVALAAETSASIVAAFPAHPDLAGDVELLVEVGNPSVDAPIDAIYEIAREASAIAARIVVNGTTVKERVTGGYPGWVVLCEEDEACIVLEGAPEGRALAERVVELQRALINAERRPCVQTETSR